MLTMMVIIQSAILVTNVKIDPSFFGRILAQNFLNQITTQSIWKKTHLETKEINIHLKI